MMKITHLLLLPLAAGHLLAQTLTDSAPGSEAPDVMLELPPATVIDEDGETDKSAAAASPGDSSEGESGPDADTGTSAEPPAGEDDGGIQIQVEKTTGKPGVRQNNGKVKVYSPWPAKPISPPPAGWKFAPAPKGTTPYRTQVKLDSGNTLDLSITPYVLVPVADGRSAIKIAEPGYVAAEKFVQRNTVGAMLQQSTAEIENHEKHAADAIRRLQQLLSSLPRQQQ